MGPVIRGFGTERGLGRAIQGSRGPAWGGGGQAEREQAGFSPLSCPLISPAPPIAEPAREREGGRAGRRSSLVQCRGGKTRDSPELSPCCVSQRGQGGGQRGRVFLGGCSSGGRLALRPWQGDGRGVWGTRVRSPPERGVGAAPGRLTGRVPQPGTQHSFVSNSALCTRRNRNCTWGAWGGQKRVWTSNILDAASAGSGSAAGGVWHTSVLVTPERRRGGRGSRPHSHAAMSLIHKARQGRPSETPTSGPFYHSVLSHYI